MLDEYGAAAGLITLEDLLEEIVGQIRDEYDESEKELIRQTEDPNTYVIAGSVKLDDVNEALHTDLDSEHYDSIGGLMIEQLDRLPHEGETVVLRSGYWLRAEEIVKNRIRSVRLTLPREKSGEVEEKTPHQSASLTASPQGEAKTSHELID